MEVPPVYAQPQRRKSKVGWIIAIVLACIACCCGGPAIFFLKIFNGSKPMLGCAMTFKDAADGIRMYAQEHNGVLPKAETWQDDVKEDYRKATEAEIKNPIAAPMPADGDWACVDGDGRRTGISYNSVLSGKKLNSVADQVSTILLYETDTVAKNQHAKYAEQDYRTSPKIVMNAPRGWMVATVAGEAGLIGERGKFVPVNISGGRNGVGVNIQAGAGTDSSPTPGK